MENLTEFEKEILKYKPFTNKENEEYLQLAQNGDEEARNKLILHNLPLVHKYAKKVQETYNEPIDDLLSEGIFAICKAIKYNNIKFFSFVIITNLERIYEQRYNRHDKEIGLNCHSSDNIKASLKNYGYDAIDSESILKIEDNVSYSQMAEEALAVLNPKEREYMEKNFEINGKEFEVQNSEKNTKKIAKCLRKIRKDIPRGAKERIYREL